MSEKEMMYFLEGLGEASQKLNDFITKLEEAREIANELSSTEIHIHDLRKKNIEEYAAELRKDFISQIGHEPTKLYLVAEGHSPHVRLSINFPEMFFEKL